ncbi:hypothetical protein [Halomicronema hongdechloris]|uniref:hypothetical protein n=1 Tax=Halomicronema hongdechloris TaxID=1209493 RepID=UPI001651431F|nr:hypothetical protein [Halomicronema hongdechloris]
MGTATGGSGNPSGALVQIYAVAHQMNRRVLPEMGDGVSLALNFDGAGGGQPSVAQLLEKRQEDAIAGHFGGCVRLGQPF